MITLLMGLCNQFDSVKDALLHRNHMPSLNDVVTELLSEEKKLLARPQTTNTVLAVHHPKSSKNSSPHACSYCHATTHFLFKCPKLICYYCKKIGLGHYQTDCYKNPSKQSTTNFITTATIETSYI